MFLVLRFLIEMTRNENNLWSEKMLPHNIFGQGYAREAGPASRCKRISRRCRSTDFACLRKPVSDFDLMVIMTQPFVEVVFFCDSCVQLLMWQMKIQTMVMLWLLVLLYHHGIITKKSRCQFLSTSCPSCLWWGSQGQGLTFSQCKALVWVFFSSFSRNKHTFMLTQNIVPLCKALACVFPRNIS